MEEAITLEKKSEKVYEKPPDLEEVFNVYERRASRRKKRRKSRKESKKSRYFIFILVPASLIFLFNHWQEWHLPFLTKDFGLVIPILNLSFGMDILGNFLMLFYDESEFKSIVYMILNFLSLVCLYFFYIYFPFEFPSLPGIDVGFWMKNAFLVAIIAVGVAEIIEFLKVIFNTPNWK